MLADGSSSVSNQWLMEGGEHIELLATPHGVEKWRKCALGFHLRSFSTLRGPCVATVPDHLGWGPGGPHTCWVPFFPATQLVGYPVLGGRVSATFGTLRRPNALFRCVRRTCATQRNFSNASKRTQRRNPTQPNAAHVKRNTILSEYLSSFRKKKYPA